MTMTHESFPRTNSVLAVDGLRKVYTQGENRIVAVDGVSFRMKRGEVVGLLGPNRGGKSTLIDILCTLLQPTAGRATVAGHDGVTDPADVRRNIGVVFQEPVLDEQLSGAENLRLHVRLCGFDRRMHEERIEEILELSASPRFAIEPLSSTSAG
ncbi:ATP-binding cassette domain-containing protein [Haladaptatus salinisoli]|uniref:ATP-binding cassette domain-containing protein n=1 Tax=Haladaptatus salinisoli TaxID=2884876 RepID=UPI001D0AD265|nr:ATP-binding cassette domain-containing protein [Haladaptatus salinisoli]